jgi:ribosomal-protein-alanine N-acetyltransferase
MKIIIEPPRLILRQFTEADAALIYELNTSPGILQYVQEASLENIEQARTVLVNIILPQYKDKLGRWAIHLKSNNEFIGWCGLKRLPETSDIDLGYRFKPAHWGLGYATEAAKHTLAYGLNQLNLKEIFGKAHIHNIASQNVLKKIGMQYFGEIAEDDTQVMIYVGTKKICTTNSV